MSERHPKFVRCFFWLPLANNPYAESFKTGRIQISETPKVAWFPFGFSGKPTEKGNRPHVWIDVSTLCSL